ncbi:hypothetical protein DFH09DRAFT_1068616 [Mycena vulgaris]|nr:hypothetical protein DFH09DRAFT_1068616 [Mycena vulgaris]
MARTHSTTRTACLPRIKSDLNPYEANLIFIAGSLARISLLAEQCGCDTFAAAPFWIMESFRGQALQLGYMWHLIESLQALSNPPRRENGQEWTPEKGPAMCS